MNWINYSHGMELEPIDVSWKRRGNENGILYLSVLYLLKYNNGTLKEEDIIEFSNIIDVLQTWNGSEIIKGLYDRGAFESKEGHEFYDKPEDRRKISHDNLTAISRISSLFNLEYKKQIATYAIDNWFRFDNQYPNSPKWKNMQFHPRDWFFWLYNGGYSICWLFFPIFFFANILTCYTPNQETSGKQLMFIRLFKQKNPLLKLNYWICDNILKKRYRTDNWLSKIVDIYYHQREDNPIRVLAKDFK